MFCVGDVWLIGDVAVVLIVDVRAGWCRSHNGGVCSLQTSGRRVFSSSADHCIKLWDLDDLVRGCKTSIVAHSQRVSHHFSLAPFVLVYLYVVLCFCLTYCTSFGIQCCNTPWFICWYQSQQAFEVPNASTSTLGHWSPSINYNFCTTG